MSGPAVRPARPARSALLAPLPVSIALAVLGAFAAFTPEMPESVTRAGQLGLAVLGALTAAIVAHDGAHWLAARLCGFRTVTFTIGPLRVIPSRRGLHVRPVRWWHELGGELIAEPPGEHRANARWALMAAAGPAASLALGVLSVNVAPLLAIASLLRFALAALPFGRDSRPSDGAQLLMLTVGGAAADRLSALRRIAAAQRAGVRPRAWPERWAVDATALRDGTVAEALGCVAAFRRAVDGCAHERAAVHLDRGLALRALLPHAEACALLADAAYFEARIHNDVPRAQAWLDEAAARHPACPVAERRATAAVLLAAGDPAAGAIAAREALALLEQIEHEEHRALPMEADWLREMLARAECASVLPDELLATAG